ncbi:hypothetical protein BLNAU_12562 [Blattamonas nauphoetae]|uniref:Uncharacterized protein n=1 Tax=Blattamonas nauphoetae TaxID=2049346 RepID=A0ABQ9XKC2_9EUKA|nr:hypothetical protein BLNAU_12562 [Blattamonas nauphoetae]
MKDTVDDLFTRLFVSDDGSFRGFADAKLTLLSSQHHFLQHEMHLSAELRVCLMSVLADCVDLARPHAVSSLVDGTRLTERYVRQILFFKLIQPLEPYLRLALTSVLSFSSTTLILNWAQVSLT